MINLSVNSRYYQQVETAERIIMTFQIMTDSTADLSPYYIKKHHLTVLGMTVTVGEETYETIGEAALDNSTLLAAIKKGATVHTSQINSGQFLEVFKKFASADEELLYLAFSSGLSGTYQSALIAQDMVLEEFPSNFGHLPKSSLRVNIKKRFDICHCSNESNSFRNSSTSCQMI